MEFIWCISKVAEVNSPTGKSFPDFERVTGHTSTNHWATILLNFKNNFENLQLRESLYCTAINNFKKTLCTPTDIKKK